MDAFKASDLGAQPDMVVDDDIFRGVYAPAFRVKDAVGISGTKMQVAGEQAILPDRNPGPLYCGKMGRAAEAGVFPHGDVIPVVFHIKFHIVEIAVIRKTDGVIVAVNGDPAIFHPDEIPQPEGIPLALADDFKTV